MTNERCSTCRTPLVWITLNGQPKQTCVNAQCTSGHQPTQQELLPKKAA